MSSAPSKWRLNGRPIVVANYGLAEKAETTSVAELRIPADDATFLPAAAKTLSPSNRDETAKDQTIEAFPPLRYNFPEAGTRFEGGHSDGYCFRLEFGASRASRNLEMIRAFLQEHGYGKLPIPSDIQELRAFRIARRERRQLQFFCDDGYVHNPIKILFPPPGSKSQSLRLEIYNEQAPKHLLKFHGRA